ncbi:hypothetical protein KFL_000220070 [Klebsormidium nitens]|uniref:Secreted protein n=1 Tax=Klebsormidium nitens TaxID=105231 RepID=A0A1Y1HK78_KLENI|nr:hypothetical protein KFL_000220070 [Klebsormidium nitens]|eukprot:GAQ78975.1 hypothetical protein KFL_000220070 [Klebsormidium nitens]
MAAFKYVIMASVLVAVFAAVAAQGRELPKLEENDVSGAARSLKQLPGNLGGLFSGGGALDPVVLLAQTLLFAITQLTNQLGLVTTLLNTAGQASQTSIAVGQILGGPLTKLLDAIANLAALLPAGTIVNP